jgi:site-specific DNA-methyltransferase (adenine-specific)
MLNSSGYNPDVLSCIANLSSDEVFTPPQLANRILDPLELSRVRSTFFKDL